MSDQTIHVVDQPSEIVPSAKTFFKAFWSATWRAYVYTIGFFFIFTHVFPFFIVGVIHMQMHNVLHIPFTFQVSNLLFEIIELIIGIFFLYFGMRALNRIIYKQDNDHVSIEISKKSILFYLLFVSIPYSLVMITSFVFFEKTNEQLMFFVAIVPNLFIFYYMMTKGIWGCRMIVRKVDQDPC